MKFSIYRLRFFEKELQISVGKNLWQTFIFILVTSLIQFGYFIFKCKTWFIPFQKYFQNISCVRLTARLFELSP